MNKNIRKIMDESSLYAVSDNSSMLFENWKSRYTEKLVELIITEVESIIIESDDSPKMVLHEPYKTIINRIEEHFHD
jgi:hypothetical protein